MPSPSVPGSSPDHRPPPSSSSTCSAPSSKFNWGKKLASKRIRRKSGSCKNSELTEESLEAHNKKHETSAEDKNNKCSPYYKGLTDASLIIGRQRHGISSPERESHATTVATSSTFSTFIAKVQEWSPCFGFKRKGNNQTKASKVTVMKKEEVFETEDVSVSLLENDKEKPLRERVSELPQPAPPLLPPKTIVLKKDSNEKVNGREFVWANNYRPKALKDFICNRDKAKQLQSLVRAGDCSHYIFEGPAGVGKRTMIWAFLRETFGSVRIQTREECKEFNLKGESVGSILVNVKISSQHVEVNLSELKGYEKHVIVELIKERHNKISNKALQSGHNCRAIILCEADKLSTDALLYVRWLLERYKGYNKIFFCCSDVSKLQPIKALCTIVQLFPPSNEEIVEVLEYIAKQESIELPDQLAKKIAENSKNNLRQAIRSFEASWQINYPFNEDQVIMTGWEDDIANIAKKIVEEQSPKQLYVIRGKLRNLEEHNVSADFIFKTLVVEMKKHLDEPLQRHVDTLYVEYNREDGSVFDNEKPLLLARNRHDETDKWLNDPEKKNAQLFTRIEEFIAKFMSCFKACSATSNQQGISSPSYAF